ncbi:ABC transporter substrate-binding protein [Halopseudomonas aestusnigri]|uniref:CmpA/NrtA family ABC transporter substrate-binding protein n=1 Tax=Halopseudomonas aestusnigri TaxID=857252 RepID=UPI001E43B1CB|nr:CmpA/NrtA family ABC transporter substrate-binding protein [Halopseudomonas aestusnigri]UGV31044.1 ABC transporter substrate-binding protein [Halopseudomonas aestusnigri]
MQPPSNPLRDPRIWASGSDAPEKPVLELGFMPLCDSASLIVAATQGFAQQHGLSLNLRRQHSWAGLRDNLLNGRLDAAQGLYGQVYGIQLGIAGPQADLAVLMGLNLNGQGITLSRSLQQAGVRDGEALARYAHQNKARLRLAHTCNTGTHALWLYYWLAAHGIHPLRDIDSPVVPPADMVEHLRNGDIDGFCAGEPWGSCASQQQLGFTVSTTQAIWPDHPEKVLFCSRQFADQHPNTARALTCAILEASRFIDASADNRRDTAQLISAACYLDAPASILQDALLGSGQNALGQACQDPHPLQFHADGRANQPWLSDALWFLSQLRRWGLLRSDPDYLAVARQVQRMDIYADAATALGIPLDTSNLRSARLCDGGLWSGSNPADYARSFSLHGLTDEGSPCASC